MAKEAEKKKKNGCRSTASRKGLGNRFHYKSTHTLYAKKMMTARKYVPLWYFLPEAATEAKERSKDSLDTDHLQFAVEDGDTLSGSTISLVGSHTVRASPNAIPDSRLSWFQVMRAKSAFLNTLRLGAWPDDHISMFVALYINMDMHSELQEQDGHRVMAHYHAEMRLAWYDAMERKEPFDLSVISDRVLAESRREKSLKGKQASSIKNHHLIIDTYHFLASLYGMNTSPFQTTTLTDTNATFATYATLMLPNATRMLHPTTDANEQPPMLITGANPANSSTTTTDANSQTATSFCNDASTYHTHRYTSSYRANGGQSQCQTAKAFSNHFYPPFPSPRQSSGKARQAPYPSPRKASRQPDNPNFQRSFRDSNQALLTRCHRCLG